VTSATAPDQAFEAIERTLKKAVMAFERAHVPYLLGGGLAAWARGGSESYKDLDFMVKPEDAQRALDALTAEGMRPEQPAEQWLLKAWDGPVLVDLIHHPEGIEIDDAVIARGDQINVFGVEVQVMALEDVLATKLLALGDHNLDYERVVQIARSLREQIDWEALRQRTEGSPYARAFFTLAEGLGIAPVAERGGVGEAEGGPPRPVRVRAA
jgi:Uncharacterised nucleotidyltransferase